MTDEEIAQMMYADSSVDGSDDDGSDGDFDSDDGTIDPTSQSPDDELVMDAMDDPVKQFVSGVCL